GVGRRRGGPVPRHRGGLPAGWRGRRRHRRFRLKPGPRVSPDLAILVLVLIWGVNFSVVKYALEQFDPLAFNGLRFALGGLVLVPFVLRRGPLRFERGEWPALIGLGVLGNTIYQVLFVEGIDRTLAGNAALMLAMA